MLGFDVSTSTALRAARRRGSVGTPTRWRSSTPSPISAPSLPSVATSTPRPTRAAVPREHLNTYLRSLDVEREGLPQWFSDRLLRALAHYGVTDLDPSPALEEALLRIFIAQQRREEQLPIVVALLEGPLPSTGLRETLDRLIEATRRRHPAIAGLARGVRYSRFDRPLIDRTRAEVYAEMKELAAGVLVDRPTRQAEQMDRLVECALPLSPILAEEDLLADTPTRPARCCAVLTRRYYKIRALGSVRVEQVGGADVCRAEYVHDGRRRARRRRPGPRRAASRLRSARRPRPQPMSRPPTPSPSTCYLPLSPSTADHHDSLAAQVRELLAAAALPTLDPPGRGDPVRCRRSTSSPSGAPTSTAPGPYWMASEPDPETFAEDVKFRGLHPMIARRLQMWRLKNFEIRPLPAPGEVHLFDCVARDTPSDERLIAVAEVRDMTPVRDDDGPRRRPAGGRARPRRLPRRHPAGPGPSSRARTASSGTGSCSTSGRSSTCPSTTSPRSPAGWRRSPRASGLEQVVVSGRLAVPGSDEPAETVMRLGYEPGQGVTVRLTEPPTAPMQPLDDYTRKLIQTRRRGLVYPYELVPLLRGEGGTFVEHDLDDGRPARARRPPGRPEPGRRRRRRGHARRRRATPRA